MPSRAATCVTSATRSYSHDPVEREPFWNRLEGLRWPEDPAAFDRRLTETLVLFASIGRTPHIWATPIHNSPADLVARLESNGFRDMGMGNVMMLVDPEPARLSATQPYPDGVTIERLVGVEGQDAEAAASAIVEVLIDAFEVDSERRQAIEGETVASLGHPWFTHYLIRADGEPATVARRATFEGVTYLSSIGPPAGRAVVAWDDRHADGRVGRARRRQRIRLPGGLR